MRLWRAGHLARAPVELDRAVARYVDCAADPRELAGALLTLGDFQFQLARYAEAEAVYRRAVDALGSAPAAVCVDALARLGHSQRRQGRFDVAEATFRAALRVDADSGVARNGLGVVYKDAGRFGEAAEQYAAALAGSGVDVALRADVFHNLAGLEHAQGRFAEAVGPAREALALRERVHGGRATEVAADAAVLGAVLAGLGDLDEAEALVQRAYGLWTRRFGADHYEAAVSLHNLAAIQVRRGDFGAASDTLREVLSIKRRTLGPRHCELAAVLNNLAAVCERQGDVEAAAEFRAEALSLHDTQP